MGRFRCRDDAFRLGKQRSGFESLKLLDIDRFHQPVFHQLADDGAGSIVSQLMKDGLMEAVDVQQLETFKAATLFAQSEGIIPAPESAHAIATAIREAEQAKLEGKPRTILFNLSGHGLIDMAAYDMYIAGDLTNYNVSDEELKKNFAEIEKL